jgi:hypothetical protein
MSTYNNTRCTLRCPRCLRLVDVEVFLYVGDTSQMVEVRIGETYPFHSRRQPQNGGPIRGVVEDAGYAECPSCGRDFFCAVEFQDQRLKAIRPSRVVPPYVPDRVAERVVACPRCGSRETRHFEFDNMEVGAFFCDADACGYGAVSTLDAARGVYLADGTVIPAVER